MIGANLFFKLPYRSIFAALMCCIVIILPVHVAHAQGEVPSASSESTPMLAGGDFVSQSGAFTQMFPIEVSPGRGGVQPNIGLAYSSHYSGKANGLVGVGWMLTGLPTITRIHWNQGISFRGDDSYAFVPEGWNGRSANPRLRLQSTSRDIYHILDNQKARFESSLRYSGNVRCGDGPCYWIMHDGNGNKLYFGGDHFDNANSGGVSDRENFHATVWGRDPANLDRGVSTWLLFKVEDIHGNYYKVEYGRGNFEGEVLPASIIYTMHPDDLGCNELTRSTCREITFEFALRNEFTPMPQRYQQRLAAIFVSSEGKRAHSYYLEYEYSPSGRSRLISIQEYGSDGRSSLPPTTYRYQNGSPVSNNILQAMEGYPTLGNGPLFGTHDQVWQTHVGDFNGDGMDDLVRVYRGISGTKIYYQLSRFDGSGLGSVVRHTHSFESVVPGASFVGDFNGNGYDDLIIAYVTQVCTFAEAEGTDALGRPYYYVDRLERGINLEWFFGSSVGLGSRAYNQQTFFSVDESEEEDGQCDPSLAWSAPQFLAGDINGNQRLDIIFIDEPSRFIAVSNTAWIFKQTPWRASNSAISANILHGAFVADINGDGYQDVILGYSNGLKPDGLDGVIRVSYALGSETGLQEMHRSTEYTGYRHQHRSLLKGDFNGNGIVDLLFAYTGFKGPITAPWAAGGPPVYDNLAGKNLHPMLGSTQGPLPSTLLVTPLVDTTNSYAYGLRSGYWDGLTDTTPQYRYAHYATWQYHTGDFNGDGIHDLVQVYRGAMGRYVYSYHGSPSGALIEQTPVQDDPTGCIFSGATPSCSVSDMNQDGDYTVHKWLSAVGDLNGDGMDDLILAYYGPNGVQIEFALGSATGLGPLQSFQSSSDTATGHTRAAVGFPDRPHSWGPQTQLLMADVNGDGKTDPILVNNAGWVAPAERKTILMLSAPGEPDLLGYVRNSLGGVTTVRYEHASLHNHWNVGVNRITANAIRPGGTPCSGRNCGIRNTRPRSLVAYIENWNGLSGDFSRRYGAHLYYDNGRVSPGPLQKREDLGFQKISRIDDQTQTLAVTHFRQDVPFQGREQISSVYVWDASRNGMTIKEVFSDYETKETYDVFTVDGVDQTVVLKAQTVHTFEAGELFIDRTVSTTYIYDEDTNREPVSFLNPVQVTTCASKGNQQSCTQTNYGYTNILSHPENIVGRVDWIRTLNPDARDPQTDAPLILNWQKFHYDDFGGRPLNLNLYQRLLFPDAEYAFCRDWDVGTGEECANEVSAGDAKWIRVAQHLRYDRFGNLEYGEDARNHGMTIQYDQQWFAYPEIETNSLNHTVSYTYDDFGRLSKITDANGQELSFRRDLFGRPTAMTLPTLSGGEIGKEVVYNDSGDPRRPHTIVVDHSSATKSHSIDRYVDGFGTVYKTVDHSDIGTIERANKEFFDGTTRVTQTSEPYFSGTDVKVWFETRYDSHGRPMEVNRVDDRGNLEKQYVRHDYKHLVGSNYYNIVHEIIDANNRSTIHSSDEWGRLTRVNDPAGNDTTYEYYPAGWLRKVTPPRAQIDHTIWRWDSWGRLISRTSRLTGTTEWEYDDVGNLTLQRNELGQETSYTYDALNRLETERTSITATYEYDLPTSTFSIGRLSRVDNGFGVLEFSYDERGNISRQTVNIVGLATPQTFQYRYDWQNQMIEKTFPDHTLQQNIYLNDGTLSEVKVDSDVYATYSDFNPYRQAQRVDTLDGAYTEYTFGPDGELESLHTYAPSHNVVTQALEYIYDGVGNLEAITDRRITKVINGVDTDVTQSFGYDALDRLTFARGVYGSLSYRYDAMGNITEKDGLYHVPSALLLANTSGIEMSTGQTAWRTVHDAAGRRIRFEDDRDLDGFFDTYLYTYGPSSDLIVSVEKNGTEGTKFYYDPFGRRIKKLYESANSVTINTYYVDSSYVLREADSASGVYAVTKSIGRLATITTGTIAGQPSMSDVMANQTMGLAGNTTHGVPEGIRFYHRDHLGSPSVIHDAGGNEIARLLNKPFGEPLRSNSIGYDLAARKFTNQESDAETELYYYRARYYDPVTARFLTPDSLTPGNGLDPQGFNRFSYVLNNPVKYVDPTGHYAYTYNWILGPVTEGYDAEIVMGLLQSNPNHYFPFTVRPVSRPPRINWGVDRRVYGDFGPITKGRVYDLPDAVWPGGSLNDVQVTDLTPTSFTFTTLENHFDGPDATITFRTFEEDGRVILQHRAYASNAPWYMDLLGPIGARYSWATMAANLSYYEPKTYEPKTFTTTSETSLSRADLLRSESESMRLSDIKRAGESQWEELPRQNRSRGNVDPPRSFGGIDHWSREHGQGGSGGGGGGRTSRVCLSILCIEFGR